MSVNLKLIENNFNAKENLTNNKYYTSYDNKKELFTKDNYNEMNQFNFDNDKIKFNSTQMNYHRSNFPIITKNKIEPISYSNPIINYDSIHPQNVKIASNLRRKFLEFQRLAKTSYMSKIGNFDKANRTSSNFKNTNNANLRNYDTFKQEKISKNIWDKRFNSSYSIKKVISDTIKEYNTKERQREIKNHLLPKSPIDNLNRPHFNHIPAINKINAEKNTKNANEQIMYKKHLKGRLLKIISDSIVLKKEQLASYVYNIYY